MIRIAVYETKGDWLNNRPMDLREYGSLHSARIAYDGLFNAGYYLSMQDSRTHKYGDLGRPVGVYTNVYA